MCLIVPQGTQVSVNSQTVELQYFTNEVMLNHNFIILLNGTKCKTIRLCHNTGGSKKSAVVSMMQVAVHVSSNFLFAQVVNRHEIKGQCFICWSHKCLGHSGVLSRFILYNG